MTRLLIRLPRDPRALVDALVPLGEEVAHRFEPHGLSLVRIGSRGSAALHTWPEHDRATLDCYGTAADGLEERLTDLGVTVLRRLTPLTEDAWNSSTS
ncbi:MAG: hypothetical protein EP330_29435 [Deltaproteobacteria bacterium]|nr:MAG: hypothetical protein EP330_29435 [Deltaproteobacteria bacterium]